MFPFFRWHGTVKSRNDASFAEGEDEENAAVEDGDEDETAYAEYGDVAMETRPGSSSTQPEEATSNPLFPFPDVNQVNGHVGDVSSMSAKQTLQQALNSAWWLGYWTALHSQKVRSGLRPRSRSPV